MIRKNEIVVWLSDVGGDAKRRMKALLYLSAYCTTNRVDRRRWMEKRSERDFRTFGCGFRRSGSGKKTDRRK